MAWVETRGDGFVARHAEQDADGAVAVLSLLEATRERVAPLFGSVPRDEVAVVLHGTTAQLHVAQPILPLVARLTAPAGRRYLVGWATSGTIHVLTPAVLEDRASKVPGSLEMLRLSPAALYVRIALAAVNPMLPPPYRPLRTWRALRWAWLAAGAAQRFSGQTAHARPAIARRLREGGVPAFPPRLNDAHLLGGTVLDLLAREEGERAAAAFAVAPPARRPADALAAAFGGRPLRDTERAWRSHLERIRLGG